MPAFLTSGSDARLWLDYTAYAGRLLAGGEPPWLDAANLVAWQRKAQGLLKSDVVALPVSAVVAAWIAKHPELVTAMAAKSRATFPLKTLLADEGLRVHLSALLSGLRASFAGTSLALAIPSPRRWIALAYAQTFGDEAVVETGADETESAAVFVADFLRAFGDLGLDLLLLEETAATEPASAAEIEWYRPVLNVAAHYRQNVGLHLPVAARDPGIADGLGFVIAPQRLAVLTGLATSASFWAGAEPAAFPAGGFRHAEIPADENPERVLERLALLRKSAV